MKTFLPRSISDRVTQRVCEKIVQNVAQPLFVTNICITLTMGEKVSKNVGYFGNLQKNLSKVNYHPMG
jgi:hypothetical protein